MTLFSQSNAVHVLREPFLRSMLFLSLLIAVALPVYERYWVYPEFHTLLIAKTERDAVRTARHLSSPLYGVKEHLVKSEIPPGFREEVETFSADFDIWKIRLFTREGEIIYSTKTEEVGRRNDKSYFHQIVAQGDIFSKVAKKQSKSMEGATLDIDVVEVYVPLMNKGQFIGAFEVYYNITDEQNALDTILYHSLRNLFFMVLILFFFTLLLMLRASREVRDRQAIQDRLMESEERFRNMASSAHDAIIQIDDKGVIRYWNDTARLIFGYSEGEAVGQSVFSTLVPERFRQSAERGISSFAGSGKGSFVNQTVELIAMKKGGEELEVELSLSSVRDGVRWLSTGIVRDISARKQMEQKLKLGASVIEHALEGVLVTDADQKVEIVNPAFCTLTGFDACEVIGNTPKVLRSNRHEASFYETMWHSINSQGSWQGEIWNKRKNGSIFLEWLSISAITDSEGKVTNYIGIATDITQRKAFEQHLERLAFYDALTGIPNRMLFHDRIYQELNLCKRRNQQLAVFYLDLDRFKQVNDTFGHKVGDMLLQEVANRLQTLLRNEDTVARLGGDEFAILLRRISNAHDDAVLIAERVIATLEQPFILEGNRCEIGTSIGISLYPFDTDSEDMLVKYADNAMYQAKRGGRNRFMFHDAPVDADSQGGEDDGG
ncbi:MAG: diguanylate cyclase [Magnetococcales bacterium]|nr:diguanylate cyclase [Magnetococcales bacterium]